MFVTFRSRRNAMYKMILWASVLATATVLLVLMFPRVTNCNWELDNCISGCRSYIDPVKDPGAYSGCVEDCKSRFRNTKGPGF